MSLIRTQPVKLFLSAGLVASFVGGAAFAQTCTPQWQTFPSGLPPQAVGSSVYADIDGPGGEGPVLVVGCGNGVRVLRNGAWTSLGGMFTTSLTMWDQDGDGPLPPRLIAGGNFNFNGIRNIAMWDGAAWVALGDGNYQTVNALTSWDPDGDGPLPPYLVSSSNFIFSGSYGCKWNGTQWSSVSGLSSQPNALISFDADGAGPQTPVLVAARFVSSGSVAFQFDGTSWIPIGSGFGQFDEGFGLGTFDFDGNGPNPAQLVLSGAFANASGHAVNGIARWDGAAWQPIGGGLGVNNYCRALATFDPDGPGPKPAELYGGGSFTSSVPGRIARFDGAAWQTLGTGADGAVLTLTPYDTDGSGPAAPKLFVGGGFSNVNGSASFHAALWGCTGDLPPPCAADLGQQGGLPGSDGQLDNNDFIAFISYFFAGDPHADLGVQGGLAGHDGQFDNNDFIAFISAFFEGC